MPSAAAVATGIPQAEHPELWTREGRGITLRELADSAHISYWRVYRLARRGVFGKPVRVGHVDLYDLQTALAYLVNMVLSHGESRAQQRAPML